jgi:hypothetical protein
VSFWQEALVHELSGYVVSPLREGDIALYRGSGTGLAPILLAAAEETSLGCVERLEHEYALKDPLADEIRTLSGASHRRILEPTAIARIMRRHTTGAVGASAPRGSG